MKHTKAGRHISEGRGRWRRKILGVPLGVWLVFILAGSVALAVWMSVKYTATNTATTSAIGEVDIGTMETDGLFAEASIQDWQPGDSVERCAVVVVDGTDATSVGDLRSYFNGAVGGTGLGDYLEFTLQARSSTSTTAGGVPCAGTWGANLMDGTLSGLATTFSDYASGVAVGAPDPGVLQGFELRATLTLPDNATTQAEAAGLDATFSFAFHNQ